MPSTLISGPLGPVLVTETGSGATLVAGILLEETAGGLSGIAGQLSATLASATLVADNLPLYRISEDDQDRVDEADAYRMTEQALPVGISGSLNATLAAATVASTATVQINASLSRTLVAATLTGAGTLALKGSLSTPLAGASLSAGGALALRATLSQSLAGATLAAAGLGLQTGSGGLSATLAAATLASATKLALKGSLSTPLAGATLQAAGYLLQTATGTLSATLSPATLVANNDPLYRVTQDDQDRVTQYDQDRVIEQAIAGNMRLEASLQPAALTAATGQSGHTGVFDPLYYRVTERSPSTLHPEPAGDVLHRVTERWRLPAHVDYRILQRQHLGTLRLHAEASVRVHVGERHFIWASRQRITCAASRARPRLIARSDYRKTRRNAW